MQLLAQSKRWRDDALWLIQRRASVRRSQSRGLFLIIFCQIGFAGAKAVELLTETADELEQLAMSLEDENERQLTLEEADDLREDLQQLRREQQQVQQQVVLGSEAHIFDAVQSLQWREKMTELRAELPAGDTPQFRALKSQIA